MIKLSGAGVVELADALDSKSSGSDTVSVRLRPAAPNKNKTDLDFSRSVLFLIGCNVGTNKL